MRWQPPLAKKWPLQRGDLEQETAIHCRLDGSLRIFSGLYLELQRAQSSLMAIAFIFFRGRLANANVCREMLGEKGAALRGQWPKLDATSFRRTSKTRSQSAAASQPGPFARWYSIFRVSTRLRC